MAASEQKRLEGPVRPMPMWPRGTSVRVAMGAGWSKGTVTHATSDSISVWLPQQKKTTRCHDARNIQRA